MSHFRPILRDVDFLLPPSVQDWLPEGHLARYVVEVVEGLDLRALEQAYSGRGSLPYHPATLLSLLIYGYATGCYSNRKIERATYDSLAFRFIAANSHPDHDTLSSFRRRFAKEFEGAFVQVLQVARENQLSRSARSAWTAPRSTPMPAVTVRCPMATPRPLRRNSKARSKSCWHWPRRPTRPIFPTA